MAMTATERKRKERELARASEEERLARLLSRSIKLDLFKGTDAKLVEMMHVLEIEEPADLITRLIHGAHRLDLEQLSSLTALK